MVEQVIYNIDVLRELYERLGISPSAEDLKAVLPQVRQLYERAAETDDLLSREDPFIIPSGIRNSGAER